MQKKKLDHLLIPYTRTNSEWITDLNVRPEIIKVLEENIGSKVLDISHKNIFFLIHLLEQEKQMGLHQTNQVLHSKGNHQQNEMTTHWMGEHIFHDTSDKGLISKMYEELIQLNTKKYPNILIKK